MQLQPWVWSAVNIELVPHLVLVLTYGWIDKPEWENEEGVNFSHACYTP